MAILCGAGVGQLCNVGGTCGINGVPAGPGNSSVIKEVEIGFSSPLGTTSILHVYGIECMLLRLVPNLLGEERDAEEQTFWPQCGVCSLLVASFSPCVS